MSANPQTPVILTTRRFTLRALSSADRDAFIAYRQDPDVARYQGWQLPYTVQMAEQLLAGQPESFPPGPSFLQVAIHDAEGNLMGDLALRGLDAEYQPSSYEIGFTVAPAAQGKGVATEAVAATVHLLFETHNAHRIVSQTDARNPAAPKLLRRVGFRHEGRNVDAEWFKDEWTSMDMWAMLRADYEKSMCKSC